MEEKHTRKVISEFAIKGNVLLVLDEPWPLIPFNKFRIDGVEYEPVMTYGFERKSIAIKGQPGLVGKIVEFLP